MAQFAGTSGDAEIRAELTTAEVVPSMLNRLCSELQSERLVQGVLNCLTLVDAVMLMLLVLRHCD